MDESLVSTGVVGEWVWSRVLPARSQWRINTGNPIVDVLAPCPRHSAGVTVVDEAIFIFGGNRKEEEQGQHHYVETDTSGHD